MCRPSWPENEQYANGVRKGRFSSKIVVNGDSKTSDIAYHDSQEK